ncbi:MAG: 2-hydroxyacid dehydrogenase [Actinomycetes bacterium]
MKEHVVWTQWEDLKVPEGFRALNPGNTPLAESDLSEITFFTPVYMSGRAGLEFSSRMSSLEILQVPNAGYDDAIEYLRPGVLLCNARGVHDASTSELAIGLGIAVRRGFHDFAQAQERGRWMHQRFASFSDSKIAIIGYGSIGQTVARGLSGFDVEIDAFSRSGSDGAKKISELDNFIGEYDIIMLTLPLNDESRKMFDAPRLAKMKDGAALINVARGGIVDTDALLTELNAGRLWAGLDVTDPEPLPEGHPLWRAKNCIIVPHVGGDSTAFLSRGKKLVEHQLLRLANGEELINIVARG